MPTTRINSVDNNDAIIVEVGGRQVPISLSDFNPRVLRAKSSATLLGDSFSDYHYDTLSSPLTGGSNRGFIHWTNMFCGHKLDIVSNRGVASETLAQIKSRMSAVATDDSDIVVFQGGHNSINPTIGNTPTATIEQDYVDIISYLSRVKRVVVVIGLSPVLNTWSGYARAGLIDRFNSFLESVCSRYLNVIFCRAWSPIVDTASANQDGTAAALPLDAIHVQGVGAFLRGKDIAQTLNQRLITTPYWAAQNIVANPTFTGVGGTSTPGAGVIVGTVPDNWTVSIPTGTPTVTVSSIVNGIRMVIANIGIACVVRLTSASVHASVASGDRLQVGGLLSAKSSTLLTRINCTLLINGTNNFHVVNNTLFTDMPQEAFTAFIRSMAALQASSPASAVMIYTIAVGATTGSVTIDITDPVVNKLTISA